eukprot:13682620-Alexandrium_andersonii.AAC.1
MRAGAAGRSLVRLRPRGPLRQRPEARTSGNGRPRRGPPRARASGQMPRRSRGTSPSGATL